MFWFARYQIALFVVILISQRGNGERAKRMAFEVLRDELDFAESIIRQQKSGDWSSRITAVSDADPSSATYASSSESPQTTSRVSTTIVPQTPHTHITSILKAIRVLEDSKEEKTTSLPSKKRYFKGAYKSLGSSKKTHTLPTAVPLKQERVTVKTLPVTPVTTKSLSTATNVRVSTKSSSASKPDRFVMQPPTVNPTTPLSKAVVNAPLKDSDELLRRSALKEHSSTRSTPHLNRESQKVPIAYLIPVDMKITSPADVISKSVTKSIQKIPKWPTSEKATKKTSMSKSIKRPIAKKVVVVKKIIKQAKKSTTPSPTTSYKYPELYSYRGQDEESEEDYSNEYRKRLQKDYTDPKYDDSDEYHYRYSRPIKRMKDSAFASNEEPEEPRIEYPPFDMPKIDLSASTLNQKGCKTVVKEVQEHPINAKNASATILHPVLYNYPPYSRKRRSVKSIIVTKECVFPGDEDGSTEAPASPYQPQADSNREIYHPYSSRRPDILKPQPSKISTDKKEYIEEPQSERYSKSYSASYHSTSKPYRKEHSYYSTSKPIVKQYSHSESSRDKGNRNYSPHEPRNFRHETYGFRPNYHNDYQGPHVEESRGIDHHGSYQVPNYERMVRENHQRVLDHGRPTNHDHVYRPVYQHDYGRHGNKEQRQEADNKKEDENEKKPKKSKKSFAFYRKDNDPKNNGFSEQYAQGSYASFSTDYDSDRDGPERGTKRS